MVICVALAFLLLNVWLRVAVSPAARVPTVIVGTALDAVVPWSGDYSGKANVPRFFEALGGSADVMAHPVNELIAQDDTVVATGDVTFKARETGKESSSSWVYIWKLRDGKLCSYDQFNDSGLADAFR